MYVRSKSGKPVYIATKKGPCGTFESQWIKVAGVLMSECLARADLLEFADEPKVDTPVEPVKNEAIPAVVVEPSESVLAKEKLQKVLQEMIENPAPGDFTSTGLPNVNVVRKKSGLEVNKDEVMTAYQILVAQIKE